MHLPCAYHLARMMRVHAMGAHAELQVLMMRARVMHARVMHARVVRARVMRPPLMRARDMCVHGCMRACCNARMLQWFVRNCACSCSCNC
eukprot:6199455-Pleurochrysis_carterae.AAC.4